MILTIYLIGCLITASVVFYLYSQIIRRGIDFKVSDLFLGLSFSACSWFTLILFIVYDLYDIISSPSVDKTLIKGKEQEVDIEMSEKI